MTGFHEYENFFIFFFFAKICWFRSGLQKIELNSAYLAFFCLITFVYKFTQHKPGRSRLIRRNQMSSIPYNQKYQIIIFIHRIIWGERALVISVTIVISVAIGEWWLFGKIQCFSAIKYFDWLKENRFQQIKFYLHIVSNLNLKIDFLKPCDLSK